MPKCHKCKARLLGTPTAYFQNLAHRLSTPCKDCTVSCILCCSTCSTKAKVAKSLPQIAALAGQPH